MPRPNTNQGFSARVDLYLIVSGARIDIGQVDHERVYFSEPVTFDGCECDLVVEIDGEARAKPIRLHPTSEPTRRVPYTPLPLPQDAA